MFFHASDLAYTVRVDDRNPAMEPRHLLTTGVLRRPRRRGRQPGATLGDGGSPGLIGQLRGTFMG